MRLAHLVFVVAGLALVLAVCREPIGRITLIVFLTGLGEVVFGLTAVMSLFQTLGAFGEAKTLQGHFEAFAATAFVLTLATAVMSGWLFAGAWLLVSLA